MGIMVTLAVLFGIVLTVIVLMVIAATRASERSKMTNTDVKLYRQAAKLLNRMVNVTELDGDIAADIVSPTTRKQIDEWLTTYRKEIDKK